MSRQFGHFHVRVAARARLDVFHRRPDESAQAVQLAGGDLKGFVVNLQNHARTQLCAAISLAIAIIANFIESAAVLAMACLTRPVRRRCANCLAGIDLGNRTTTPGE